MSKIYKVTNHGSRAFLLSIFISWHLFGFAVGEPLFFRHIDTKDGLSQSSIIDIHQSKDGYIWLATQDGLNRYDGYDIVVFKHEPNDPQSLPANFIWSIAEDAQGHLWIGTDSGGLSRYDPKTAAFTNFQHNSKDDTSLPDNQVMDVYVDKQNRLWVATAKGGLALFNRATNAFLRFQNTPDNPNMLNSNTIKVITEAKDGKLWLGYSHAPFLGYPGAGLSLFDPATSINRSFTIKAGLSDDNVTDLLVTKDNKLWVTTYGGGLDLLDPESFQFRNITLPSQRSKIRAMAITQDLSGTLWIPVMSEGIVEFDPETERSFLHQNNKLEDLSLPDNSSSQIFINDNLLLVGSWQAGLSSSNLLGRQFGKVLTGYNQPNGLSSPDVTHISFSDPTGHVWMANGVYLLEFDVGMNLVARYSISDLIQQANAPNVLFVYADDTGRVWFNSRQFGLYSFIPKVPLRNEIQLTTSPELVHPAKSYQQIMSNRRITAMEQIGLSKYLIGSRASGLSVLDIASEQITELSLDGDRTNKEPLAITKNGILRDDIAKGWWIATTNAGVAFFSDNFKLFLPSQLNQLLNQKLITSLTLESDNKLWVGTQGRGIFKLSWDEQRSTLNKPEIDFYTENDGLSSSAIGTLFFSQSSIWATTTQGISRIDTRSNNIINFDIYDGTLPEYSIGVGIQVNNELVILGGFHGVSYFYPSEIQLPTEQRSLIINELLLSNKLAKIVNDPEVSPLQNSVVQFASNLNFHYKNSHFSLGFVSPEYVDPKSIKYAYRLKGFDKNWLYTDASRRYATYTNLDPGDYIFELRSSDRFGRWNEQALSLDLSVEAAPWKSWWAYLTYVVTVLVIILSFLWQRLMQLKLIKERNKQLSITSKLFENTSEGVILFDKDFRISIVNQGYCNITGCSSDELTGSPLKLPEVEEQSEIMFEEILDNVSHGEKWQGELWAQRKSGEIFPIEIVVDRIEKSSEMTKQNGDKNEHQYVAVLSDITQRKKDEKKLKELAFYDELTLLPNRSNFERLVEKEIKYSSEHKLPPFAVMFIDLDNFKSINDSLGHNVGDKFLQKLAKNLRYQIEHRILIGRLGGDEFLILAPATVLQELEVNENCTSSQAAVKVAQTIFDAASQTVVVDEYKLRTTCSIGIAIYPQHGLTFERLLRNADTAMYEAKKDLYFNIHCYDKQMNVFARYQFEVAEEIREDIRKNLFIPYFQAKADTKTGKVCGVEVLTRWHNKKLRWVEPIQFIPIAEERGLINVLTEQVIELACEQVLPLIQQGKLKGRMSINLSPVQFHQVDIVERILAILKRTQFPAQSLEIEVTESVAIHDRQQALEHMHKIRDAGIRIALDDFGTGYSSLSYLHKYPLDIVKIDRSFVGELMINEDNQKVTSAIINMSHSLGLTVTAEGVEDTSQLRYLTEQNCDYIQGFLFHKPCDIQHLIDFIESEPKLF